MPLPRCCGGAGGRPTGPVPGALGLAAAGGLALPAWGGRVNPGVLWGSGVGVLVVVVGVVVCPRGVFFHYWRNGGREMETRGVIVASGGGLWWPGAPASRKQGWLVGVWCARV